MKLGRRVAALTGWTTLALAALALAVVSSLGYRAFREAEEHEVSRLVLCALRALDREGEVLDRSVRHWAEWHDSYRFVKERTPEFIRSKLVPSTFQQLDVDLIAYTDETGAVVWIGGRQPSTPPSSEWPTLLRPDGALHHLVGYTFHRVEGKPCLVAAREIRTSERRGPARGKLFMARSLTPEHLRALSRQMGVEIGLRPPAELEGLDCEALDALRTGTDSFVTSAGISTVFGHALLKDAQGTPVALLSVKTDRDILRIGMSTIGVLAGTLVVLWIAGGLVFFHLLRRHGVGRVEDLAGRMAAVEAGSPPHQPIAIAGSDELTELACQADGMVTRLEAATAAAERSRAAYEQLFNSVSAGAALHEIILDEQGNPVDYRFLDTNPAFSELTGLSREEVIGRTVREVLPDMEPVWIERFGRVALTGEPTEFTHYARALGKYYRVSAFSPVRGQFACLFFDVTELEQARQELADQRDRIAALLEESERSRRALLNEAEERARAEQDLRESELRFSLAFHNAPYVMVLAELGGGQILELNDAFCQITGYAREEALEPNFAPQKLWVYERERAAVLGRLREQGEVRNVECRFRCKDGRILTGLVSGNVLDIRGRKCMLFSVNDITERRKAEDLRRLRIRLLELSAGQELEEWITELLRQARDTTQSAIAACCIVEEDETTVWLSAWAAGDESQVRIVETPAPGEPPFPFPWDLQALRNGPIRGEQSEDAGPSWSFLPEGPPASQRCLVVPILRSDRVRIALAVANAPHPYGPDDEETLSSLADVALSIAESKRAQRRQRALEQQLSHSSRLEAIGQLAGGVAHDFNNTLMIVLGSCNRLAELLEPGTEAWELLERIRTAGRRAAATTRRLLTFGRRQPVTPRVLDVNRLVREFESTLRIAVGSAVSVDLRCDDAELRVKADQDELEQAILNLATNARDAMPEGGVLTVAVDRVRFDEGSVPPNLSPGEYARISVTDTGTGIEPHLLEHIFEPFYTTKPRGHGTGLGLPSVYGAMRAVGGHVDCSSVPGKGSTFRLYLPVTDEPLEPEMVEEEPAELGAGQTVLLVEDSEETRAVLEAMIRSLGYRVAAASSGREALALVAEQKLHPHVIVSDVAMPEMSGPQMVRAIRQMLPECPVVYVSGYAHDVLERDGAIGEDTPLLTKPFRKENLGQAIARVLRSVAGPPVPSSVRFLVVDDDFFVQDLVRIAAERSGHSVRGAMTLPELREALRDAEYDLVLLDLNLPGTHTLQVLEELRKTGCQAPVILHTGDEFAEVTPDMRALGVIGIVVKSSQLGEAVQRAVDMLRRHRASPAA